MVRSEDSRIWLAAVVLSSELPCFELDCCIDWVKTWKSVMLRICLIQVSLTNRSSQTCMVQSICPCQNLIVSRWKKQSFLFSSRSHKGTKTISKTLITPILRIGLNIVLNPRRAVYWSDCTMYNEDVQNSLSTCALICSPSTLAGLFFISRSTTTVMVTWCDASTSSQSSTTGKQFVFLPKVPRLSRGGWLVILDAPVPLTVRLAMLLVCTVSTPPDEVKVRNSRLAPQSHMQCSAYMYVCRVCYLVTICPSGFLQRCKHQVHHGITAIQAGLFQWRFPCSKLTIEIEQFCPAHSGVYPAGSIGHSSGTSLAVRGSCVGTSSRKIRFSWSTAQDSDCTS